MEQTEAWDSRTAAVLEHQDEKGAARVCWACVPPLEDDYGQDKHLYSPVLRGTRHVLLQVLRHAKRHFLRRVLHVLVLHVSPGADLVLLTPKRIEDAKK